MPLPPDRLLSTVDVGRLLQVDPSSIVKWVNDGRLPAFRTPGGHRRIRVGELLTFLRAHQMYIPPDLEAGVRRVLIVDADSKLLKSVQRGLKPYADVYQVRIADNAVDALVELGARPPDVLVVDVGLPGLSGLELLDRLKANPATATIEVVVLASRRTADLERKAQERGAKAVLVKPLALATLKDALGSSRGAPRRS